MRARKLSMVMASYGHTLSHLLHAIHPTLHTFFVSAPLSSERQNICTSLFSGTSSRRFLGHGGIHNPQPVHLSSITTGSPFLLMYMASKGHAFSNSHCKTHTSCITTRAAISMWQETVNLRNLGVNFNAELFSCNTKPQTCQCAHGTHCNYG